MQIPFVGQYLASHGASNGDLGYLILNVDSDTGGKGIVYQSSVIPGNSAIYECQVFVDQNGVISGHAVRSKRLETFHRMQTPDEVHELTFKLEPRDGLDLLTIVGSDESESVQALQPIEELKKIEAEKLTSWDEFIKWA